jgi:YD repeat-containing protein
MLAGGGPTQPEAAQFEPVDAKDMVNLYTGDFTYSVPLLEVPGPEGGWPISMSYHAGIGPNTEATWVGLGWTLNPGSINRFVNGYPDDMYAGQMETEYRIEPIKGWGVGIGISYGPIGMSINYDSRSGLGVNATISLVGVINYIADAQILGDIGNFGDVGFRYDVDLSIGTSGVGLSTSLGAQIVGGSGIGASLGISAGVHTSQGANAGIGGGVSWRGNEGNGIRNFYNSMSLMGASWSTQGGGASFSVAGTGFQNTAQMEGSGHLNSSSSSFFIPLGLFVPVPGLGLSVSYYEWEWWLHEQHYETAFGTLHQLSYLNEESDPNPYNYRFTLNYVWGDFFNQEYPEAFRFFNDLEKERYRIAPDGPNDNPPDRFYSTKVERNLVNSVLFGSEDSYMVNAQGLTGSFKPNFDYAYTLYDASGTDQTGKFAMWNDQENTGRHIVFRFDSEEGGNFSSRSADGHWEGITAIRDTGRQNGSKKITPVISPTNGGLVGFRVVSEDGRICEFFKPVHNYYYNSVSLGTASSSPTTYRYTQKTPYATSWYLTGVKGPDYVDLTDNGFSSDDLGYWVQFQYGENPLPIGYRAPFRSGTSEFAPGNAAVRIYSEGIRGAVYLESIETASHIGRFETSTRLDDQNAQVGDFNTRVQVSRTGSVLEVAVQDISSDAFIGMGAQILGATISAWYHCVGVSRTNDPQTQIYQSGDISNLTFNGGVVRFQLPNRFPNSYGRCSFSRFADSYATLHYNVSSLSSAARSLSRIAVFSKSNQSEIVEGVALNTAYQLMPGSPNTNPPGGRKLTLLGIKKLGRGGVTVLPETRFTYNTKDLNDDEVDWYADKYDNWNGYTSVGANAFHYNSDNKAQADNDAGMWNLSTIYTPLGSRIKIDYECDNVRSVGTRLLTKGTPPVPDSMNAGGSRVKTISIIDATRTKKTLYKYAGGNTPCLPSDYQWKGTRNEIWQTNVIGQTVGTLFERVNVNIKVGIYSGNGQFQWIYNGEQELHVPEPIVVQVNVPASEASNIAVRIQRTGGDDDEEGVRISHISSTYGSSMIYPYATVEREGVDGDHTKIDGVHPDGYIEILGTPSEDYITMILPRRFSDGFDQNALLSGGFNTLGPRPAVGYQQVEVMEVNPTNDEPLNGKMVHEFFTSKDPEWQFTVQRTENTINSVHKNLNGGNPINWTTANPGELSQIASWIQAGHPCQLLERRVEWWYDPGRTPDHGETIDTLTLETVSSVDNQRIYFFNDVQFRDDEEGSMYQGRRFSYFVVRPGGSVLRISDNSGIYGRMKSITTYGQRGTSPVQFYPLQKTEFIYKSSSQLAADNSIGVFNKGVKYAASPKLGITQQKYVTRGVGMPDEFIDHQRENIYLIGTTVTNWFYNDQGAETGSQIALMNNIGYDAYTGKITMSVNRNEKNQQIVSEQIPAYWRPEYAGMETKNMLTQLAETRGYIVADGVNFLQLTEPQKYPYLTSSSVTTWKDWAPTGHTGVWRQNDVYGATKVGNQYNPFVWWNSAINEGDNPSAFDILTGWKRTSNITKFDRYGHPIEERSLDNQYTSSLYGHGDALPVAIATNARVSEISALDFEEGVTGGWGSWYPNNGSVTSTGRTGVKGWSFNGTSYGVLSKTFQGNEVQAGRKYMVSGWVKTTSNLPDLLWYVRYNNGGSFAYPASVSAQGTGQWEYVSLILYLDPVAYPNIVEVNVYARNGSNTTWADCMWDGLRFHPLDASMSTYTYDPLTWKLTSITDQNNITSYFEYDKAGRLVAARDKDRNIVKRHSYQYGRAD